MSRGEPHDGNSGPGCTILFPGLLGPNVPLAELPSRDWPLRTQVPNLMQVLKRGHIHPIDTGPYEYHLLDQLGFHVSRHEELPVAELRAQKYHQQSGDLWCVDPVCVQLDREGASLSALDEPGLTQDEARQLVKSINEHFGSDIQVQICTPRQWIAHIPLQLRTHTPGESVWRELGQTLPSGEDAAKWRRLLNEIQMLLHSHPVNLAREEAGQLPINSLWLWGGGKLTCSPSGISQVFSSDILAEDAAAVAGIACAHVPPAADRAGFAQRNSLLILNAHVPAVNQMDVYAWLNALLEMEQRFLAPLTDLLTRGELTRLNIISESLYISLGKRDLRRWWVRRRSLADSILSLRARYDH